MLTNITRILKSKAGLAIIALSVVVLLAAAGLPLNTYRPGWEISTELVAMQLNIPSGAIVKTYPPTANIQDDFDQATWGLPDIKATAGDVRELQPPMPYEPLQRDLGKFKYVVTYHEYAFDVQIRTLASAQINNDNPDRNNAPLGTLYWEHETSLPASYACFYGQGGTSIGRAFDGGVFARFSCLPWGILDYGPVPENYTFNGYYLGVMNAKIESYAWGKVADIESTAKEWVRNVESVGSPLNMYSDDGTYARKYTEVPWDPTKVFDPDIKSVVIVYVPFNLEAGAYHYYSVNNYCYNGAITELKPVDVFLTYTIRMETLVVKQFEQRDPGAPPNPSPIENPEDYVAYNGVSFWDQYGFAIIVIVIFGVILFFAAIIVVGPVLLMLLLGVRMCERSKGVKWKWL